jgi:hypothetical protein
MESGIRTRVTGMPAICHVFFHLHTRHIRWRRPHHLTQCTHSAVSDRSLTSSRRQPNADLPIRQPIGKPYAAIG